MNALLQIIHTAANGGAEKHTRLITKAFAKKGIPVVFVYPPGPYASEYESLEQHGVICIQYDLKSGFFNTIRFIRSCIRKYKIDTIHSHLHGADFLAAVACMGMKGVTLFSTIHFLPQNNPGLIFRIKTCVMTAIGWHRAQAIFAVSSEVARKARRFFLLPAKKVHLALNSIDFDEMAVDTKNHARIKALLKPSPQDRLILCTGSFVERKGQLFLIDALAQCAFPGGTLRLVLMGEGEMEKQLRDRVAQLNLTDRVVFGGFQTNIADYLACADIYVQPSLIDPLPRALLEAMYMAVPVVVSDLPSFRDVIRDGVTALSVVPGDSMAIRHALESLLGDQTRAHLLGQGGRDFILSHCSMDGMAQTVMDTLNN